jgi:predicted peptidase
MYVEKKKKSVAKKNMEQMSQIACTFPTPGRAFDQLAYLLYVPPPAAAAGENKEEVEEEEERRPAPPPLLLPLVLFLHGADEADKTRVLRRDPATGRRCVRRHIIHCIYTLFW